MASPASSKSYTGDPKNYDTSQPSLTGHCLCGSITVTIHDGDIFTGKRGHLCHCANCRKVAGAHCSTNLLIEKAKVEIKDMEGTLKSYMDTETGSGTPIERFFCGRCGNPIKSESPRLGDKVVVKMGMFPRIPEPEHELFVAHRQPWLEKNAGAKQWLYGIGGAQAGD